jgi:DNA-binding GntR family transcriptional regulator
MKPDAGSHAGQIVRELEEEILLGRRLPGDRLDERSLAAQFGVSRTPVREALQRLATSGLVTLKGRRGACVAQLSVSDLLDAFYVVAELEALAARQAARRVQPEQRSKLKASHAECSAMAKNDNPAGFYEANLRFHGAIIEACHNRVLQEQLRSITVLTSPYRRCVTYQPGRMVASVDEHKAVMDAIFGGDGEQAYELMRHHVNLLGDGLSDLLHYLRVSGMSRMVAS